MLIILSQRIDTDSDYSDEVFETYHYPSRYKNQIHEGDTFVYYQGNRYVKEQRYYFGVGTIGQITTFDDENYYASLINVRKFNTKVPIYRVPFACFYLSEIPPKKPRLYYDRRTERLGTSVYDDISYALWSEIQRIMSDRDSILEWTDVDYPEAVLPSVSNESVVDTAKTIREYFEMSTPLKSKSAYGSNPFSY